ncbi:60S ribosomal protein L27, partial [Trichinella pseudospiralis]
LLSFAKMGKIMKPGRVVIVLAGKYAGRKAIVIKTHDEGSADRNYGYAFVAGVDQYPLQITRKMGKLKQAKRIKIRPFLKVVNHSHLLPTRYIVELNFDKSVVNEHSLRDKVKCKKAKRDVRQLFEERYKLGKNKWFFTKLRF